MRKQTKLVAVLSAAALLAIGASMTSFAAKGWQEENGQWYYYDNGGDCVYDEWKKSGNNWFYLGDDGAMVTDSLVEDGSKTYYVNANGAMVTNSWVAVEPGEDDDYDAPDHYWYYFGANGQAVKQTGNSIKKKTINGKTYAFDSDGKMLYGFVDGDGERLNDQDDPYEEAVYYFGTEDDGAMHTDWLLYTDGSTDDAYEDYEEMWFYFKPATGKKAQDGTSTIRGNKYLFDANGVMEYDWQITDATVNTATISKYFSDQTDGHMRKKTWVWAIPDEDQNSTDHDDETERWFYVGSNGNAYTGLRSVNGKKYLFDEYGIMKAGLQVVKDNKLGDHTDIEDDSEEVTGDSILTASIDGNLYYFGDEETDGSMKTGKNIKIELDDGETYTFGFGKTGKAMNGFEDKNTKYYVNGMLITASSDYKYQVFKPGTDAKDGVVDPYDANWGMTAVLGNEYKVVSNSGSIVKTKKAVRDTDGNYYAVNAKGEVAFVSADHEYASKAANCYAKSSNGSFGQEKWNKDHDEITGWTCD